MSKFSVSTLKTSKLSLFRNLVQNSTSLHVNHEIAGVTRTNRNRNNNDMLMRKWLERLCDYVGYLYFFHMRGLFFAKFEYLLLYTDYVDRCWCEECIDLVRFDYDCVSMLGFIENLKKKIIIVGVGLIVTII